MKRTCIVAMRQETFNIFQDELVYPVPARYPRASKQFSHIATYRKSPVSAITHTAQIKHTETVNNPTRHIEKIIQTDYDKLKLFHLEELRKISTVENDQSGIRGARYSTVKQLKQAEYLSEINYSYK